MNIDSPTTAADYTARTVVEDITWDAKAYARALNVLNLAVRLEAHLLVSIDDTDPADRDALECTARLLREATDDAYTAGQWLGATLADWDIPHASALLTPGHVFAADFSDWDITLGSEPGGLSLFAPVSGHLGSWGTVTVAVDVVREQVPLLIGAEADVEPDTIIDEDFETAPYGEAAERFEAQADEFADYLAEITS